MSEVVTKVLEDLDLKVKRIEDKELSRWSRFKRRYFSGRPGFMYVVGGNVTLLQVAVGNKIIAWFVVKFPWISGILVKAWSALVSVTIGAYHLITH